MVAMVMGRCERTYRLGEARTADVARRYVNASAGKGWVRMLDLQGRRDPGGTFRVYELSGRFTGASAARLHLDFDEVGMLIEAFTGCMLPPPPPLGSAGVVTKSLADFPLPDGAVEQLQAAGRWQPG